MESFTDVVTPNRTKNRILTHQIWIHGINGVLFILLLFLAVVSIQIFSAPRFYLFPIRIVDPIVIYSYASIIFLFLVLLFGTIGVLCANRILLHIYFLGMVFLVLSDVIIGILWAFKMRTIHITFLDYLHTLVSQHAQDGNGEFCECWNLVQRDLECCGTASMDIYFDGQIFCGQNLTDELPLPYSCCPELEEEGPCNKTLAFAPPCMFPLLEWFHQKASLLFLIGYSLLFSLKLIFILILHREIDKNLHEIFYKLHQQKSSFSWSFLDRFYHAPSGSHMDINSQSSSTFLSRSGSLREMSNSGRSSIFLSKSMDSLGLPEENTSMTNSRLRDVMEHEASRSLMNTSTESAAENGPTKRTSMGLLMKGVRVGSDPLSRRGETRKRTSIDRELVVPVHKNHHGEFGSARFTVVSAARNSVLNEAV